MSNKNKIIAIANLKGGIGKTTTAISVAFGLNKLGKNILLVDMDPQNNVGQSLGLTNIEYNIYGALRGFYPLMPKEVTEGLSVVPSTIDLSGAEVELSSEPGREYIFKELLEPIKDNFDIIIIDCSPSFGILTINALTACDEVFIPLQPEILAMNGISKLFDIIEKIKKRLNKDLKIGGILITMFDKRLVLNRDVVLAIEAHSKELVFKTKIRNSIALAEAPAQGLDIFRYNPKSNGAQDYMALCKEILKR